MTLLRIDDLAAGMVLKSNVCDRNGRLLIPAGAELSEKHLKIFRTWGVSEADVAVEDGGEGPLSPVVSDADPARLAEAEAAVVRLFSHCDQELPAIKELMRLCIDRKVNAHGS